MVYTTDYYKLWFMVIAYDLHIVLTNQEVGPQITPNILKGYLWIQFQQVLLKIPNSLTNNIKWLKYHWLMITCLQY